MCLCMRRFNKPTELQDDNDNVFPQAPRLKKEAKSVEQLRREVDSKDREYKAEKEATRLHSELERCEVEIKQCRRLIERRSHNPLGRYSNRDLICLAVT